MIGVVGSYYHLLVHLHLSLTVQCKQTFTTSPSTYWQQVKGTICKTAYYKEKKWPDKIRNLKNVQMEVSGNFTSEK